MATPSLEDFRRRLAEAGWHELRADPGFGFGSWSIELEWALRVEYNGKDGRLSLHRRHESGQLENRLERRAREDQTPTALLDALRSAASER